MKKTLNINLAGMIFHIDEDAFFRLESYLEILKRQFSHTEGGNEIISDIETRIAELFRERTTDTKEVINLDDVKEVIAIMGEPEDYLDVEDLDSGSQHEEQFRSKGKRIFRDPDNRIFGGVSSGLAAYFNIDPVWIRLLFVILFFSGPGILVYIIMWIVIPKATTTAEKLQMRGEPVNIPNIQRSIRDEMKGVEESARRFSRRAANYDYNRSARGVGGFFSNLGNLLIDTIRLIFNFLFKLIGFIFLALGFLLLFAIVMSLLVGTVDIAGTEYGVQHFFDFMRLVTENESHYSFLMIALVLSIIAPLFLLIYFGIRILFDLDPLNRPTKSALGLTTFIGLVLLLIAGVRVGLQFDESAKVESEIALPQHRVFLLKAGNDSIDQEYARGYDAHWINYEDADAFNLVNVDVRETEEDQPFVSVRIESQGESRKEARNRAQEVQYEINVQDSVITLPTYYLLGEKDKFRAQRINVVLYLPVGHAVHIDQSIADYLYDVDNVQHMWDYDMPGKLWIMSEYGLSCEGCKIPVEEQDKSATDTSETDSIEKKDADGNFRMRLDENGMEIRYKSKEDSTNFKISANDFKPQVDSLNILNRNYEVYI